MSTGTLIVLEGLDGSGKSTQFDLTRQALAAQGVTLSAISFPDYKEPSSALVKQYLAGEFGKDANAVNAYAASTFYAADRFASYKKFWQNDYEKGTMILAARYTTSNAIYQMSKLPEEQWPEYLNWLSDFEYQKMGLPVPDAVFFLDMPVEVSQALLNKRYAGDETKRDLHEQNTLYLERCRQAAYYAADYFGWHIIPCAEAGNPLSIETVNESLIAAIKGATSA